MTWKRFIEEYLRPRKAISPAESVTGGMTQQQFDDWDEALDDYFEFDTGGRMLPREPFGIQGKDFTDEEE